MSNFFIEYKFENHGWATIRLSNGKEKFESSVSYLHDSLADLAQMAIDLKNGSTTTQSLFMGEPGELLLVIKIQNNKALCEARRFRDWASWGILPDTEFEIVLSGTTTANEIVKQVSESLTDIYDNIGIEEYKKRWIEHDFPTEKYLSIISG